MFLMYCINYHLRTLVIFILLAELCSYIAVKNKKIYIQNFKISNTLLLAKTLKAVYEKPA